MYSKVSCTVAPEWRAKVREVSNCRIGEVARSRARQSSECMIVSKSETIIFFWVVLQGAMSGPPPVHIRGSHTAPAHIQRKNPGVTNNLGVVRRLLVTSGFFCSLAVGAV